MLVLLCAFMLMAVGVGTKGGELPFAASAKSKGQREESGRSGLRLSFFDVQTQRTAAVSPLYRISITRRMAAIKGAASNRDRSKQPCDDKCKFEL
jgi:hypothetical protein